MSIINNKKLSQRDLFLLKQKQLVDERCEIVYIEGDIVIAENVITQTKRIVNCVGLMLESTKKILLG